LRPYSQKLTTNAKMPEASGREGVKKPLGARDFPMAQHEVEYTTPSAWLDARDLVFVVQRDGVKLGELLVSKGSVVWFPYNTRYGY
jgi:hypothetical protein